MENQVLSLELCKKFKELGIEIKTEFYISEFGDLIAKEESDDFWERISIVGKPEGTTIEEHYPAPTLSELLEIVPVLNDHEFSLGKQSNVTSTWYYTEYKNIEEILFLRAYGSPIEAVGELLIYLKENNLI